MVALVLCYSFTSQYINPSFLHSRQMVMKLLILHRLPDRFYYFPEPDEPEESGTEEKKNDGEKGVATDPPKKRMMKNKGKTTSTDGVCSQWPDGRSPAVQAYKVFLHHEWLKHLQAGTLHYLFLSSS